MTEYNEDMEASETSYESDEDTGDDFTGDEEQPDIDALKAENEKLKEELAKTRADKNGILKKLKAEKAEAKPDVKGPDYSERMDRIELRALDKELTSDNISEILTYAKAKGLDVVQAFNSPMIQAYLKADREEKSKEAEIKAATPKASNRGMRGTSGNARKYEKTNDGLAQMLEESVLSKN